MTGDVERVACALAKAMAGEHVNPHAVQNAGPSATRGEPFWKYYEIAARGALAALRNPYSDETRALLALDARRNGQGSTT